MPLLSEKQLAEDTAKRASFRLKTAGTKLNEEETAALEKHCRHKGVTPGELIRQTDEKLYNAKRSGRNQIHLAPPVLA